MENGNERADGAVGDTAPHYSRGRLRAGFVRQFAPFVFPGPDVIRLRNVALRRGEKRLLQDAQLMVHAGQKLGVVGPNGCGKTSLFAMLCGELHADAGDVEVPASWLVSRVEQEVEASERPAIEYALDGDVELRAAEAGIEAAGHSGDG